MAALHAAPLARGGCFAAAGILAATRVIVLRAAAAALGHSR
jgi:hypothetical protein